MRMVAALATIPIAQHKAFLCGIALTSAKTALADVCTQSIVLHRNLNELDWRRVSIFALYGLTYLGAVQFLLYSVYFPRIFPRAAAFAALSFGSKLKDHAGQLTVLSQVALDQGLHWPLLAIPAFHLFKGFGEGLLEECVP